jgi:hypothetical protein
MNRRVPPAQALTRNPIARSLALAVLGVALVGAAIMGAIVFAVLLGLFIVGYVVSLAHGWWRLFRAQRRAARVDQPQPSAVKADCIEAEYEVVEAAADAARPGSGGSA